MGKSHPSLPSHQKHDSITYGEWLTVQGETAAEIRARPTPWWMIMGEKKPDPPRVLRVRARATGRDLQEPPRPEGGTRRKLVRVGALRQNVGSQLE
jgi:hypothetical protein